MEKIYLLKKDKIMLGPYTLEKLKERALKPSDLVWYEGLADWTPAGEIAALNVSKETGTTEPVLPPRKRRFSLRSLFKRSASTVK